MAYEVVLIEEAIADVDMAAEWYEDEQESLGARFYLELTEHLLKLKLNPQHYSFFFEKYRQVVLKNFPFRIVFKIEGTIVFIMAVFHTSRNPKEFTKRLR